MTLADKYGRLRTDMEDMIEAHQENARTWDVIKKFYEEQHVCPPTVCLDAIIRQQLDLIGSMHDALVRAKNWMQEEADLESMHPHDRAVYADTMEKINNAIKKATE